MMILRFSIGKEMHLSYCVVMGGCRCQPRLVEQHDSAKLGAHLSACAHKYHMLCMKRRLDSTPWTHTMLHVKVPASKDIGFGDVVCSWCLLCLLEFMFFLLHCAACHPLGNGEQTRDDRVKRITIHACRYAEPFVFFVTLRLFVAAAAHRKDLHKLTYAVDA